jgi:hypothetical protein
MNKEMLESHQLVFHPQVILTTMDLKDYDTIN